METLSYLAALASSCWVSTLTRLADTTGVGGREGGGRKVKDGGREGEERRGGGRKVRDGGKEGEERRGRKVKDGGREGEERRGGGRKVRDGGREGGGKEMGEGWREEMKIPLASACLGFPV